jgi:hypothetical protein
MIYQDLHSYAANPVKFAPEVRQALTRIPQRFDAWSGTWSGARSAFIHDQPAKTATFLVLAAEAAP